MYAPGNTVPLEFIKESFVWNFIESFREVHLNKIRSRLHVCYYHNYAQGWGNLSYCDIIIFQ